MSKYPSLCMTCIATMRQQGNPVTMLTTYCLPGFRCDGCKRTGDLAMCSERPICIGLGVDYPHDQGTVKQCPDCDEYLH